MADKKFFAGDAKQVWHRDSDTVGPHIAIFGGIHGDELAGIEVVKRMVSGEFYVPLERGRLTVALGNVAAIEAGVRYIKRNANRIFRDYTEQEMQEVNDDPDGELARIHTLKPLLDDADSCLDLHGFRQFDGDPFIITEPREQRIGSKLFHSFQAAAEIGAPYISYNWSNIEAGGTDGYMEAQGKIGICHELAQLEDVKRGVPRGEQSVLNFLNYMQLISITTEPAYKDPQYVHAEQAILAQDNFTWGEGILPLQSWQPLQAGRLIAQNGRLPSDAIYAKPNQLAIFPSNDPRPKPGDEMLTIGTVVDPATMLGGAALSRSR